MNFAACASKPLTDHGDVCHGGELYENVSDMAEYFILQSEHIRGAVLNEEHFLSAFSSSCRVEIYDVRPMSHQKVPAGLLSYFYVVYFYVFSLEYLEVMLGCLTQGLLHFAVDYF